VPGTARSFRQRSSLRYRRFLALPVALALHIASSALADVIVFTDVADWQSAAPGSFGTITFTELPAGTFVTDQYVDSYGIAFTDGLDVIDFAPYAYPTDEFVLRGVGDIDLAFSTPQFWLGVDYPGDVTIELYDSGELIFSSAGMLPGGGTGFFGGIISTDPFDSVVLRDPIDGLVFIDNLHFGPPIPAPGALGVLTVAAIILPRRHRSRRVTQS
jgi:hypothetical protein